jgi:hypothetical protein
MSIKWRQPLAWLQWWVGRGRDGPATSHDPTTDLLARRSRTPCVPIARGLRARPSLFQLLLMWHASRQPWPTPCVDPLSPITATARHARTCSCPAPPSPTRPSPTASRARQHAMTGPAHTPSRCQLRTHLLLPRAVPGRRTHTWSRPAPLQTIGLGFHCLCRAGRKTNEGLRRARKIVGLGRE